MNEGSMVRRALKFSLILTPFLVLSRFKQVLLVKPGSYTCSKIDYRSFCPSEWQTPSAYMQHMFHKLFFYGSGVSGFVAGTFLTLLGLTIVFSVVFAGTFLLLRVFAYAKSSLTK